MTCLALLRIKTMKFKILHEIPSKKTEEIDDTIELI